MNDSILIIAHSAIATVGFLLYGFPIGEPEILVRAVGLLFGVNNVVMLTWALEPVEPEDYTETTEGDTR